MTKGSSTQTGTTMNLWRMSRKFLTFILYCELPKLANNVCKITQAITNSLSFDIVFVVSSYILSV